MRGEVWWAQVNERCPVVLLGEPVAGRMLAMIIVEPAQNIEGVAVEIGVGHEEGLTAEGVLRVALPRLGKINCNWIVTLPASALLERAGAVSPAKLRQIEQALHLSGLELTTD